MPYDINDTHDAKLTSWVESANDPASDFPIQNLPFGVFCPEEDDYRIGVAIGDQVLDLQTLSMAGLLGEDPEDPIPYACEFEALNVLMLLEPEYWSRLRKRVSELLRADNPELRDNEALRQAALFAVEDVTLALPCEIADYTDFYASVHHATNVGSMFRPDNPLLPNYKHIPIGYHGRASSIGVSGQDVRRPCGQLLPGATIADGDPQFGPCKLLDYELEVGAFVGQGNDLGTRVPIGDAWSHLFGLCLVNDWSARDIQKWEYQPLGPFLAKSFATTISPWVVTMEALAPFRTGAFERPAGDPKPQDYLHDEDDQKSGGVDLTLEVYLSSKKMRDEGMEPVRLSRGSFREMYWTLAQMLAHHSSNGCNMQPGDLIASGTVSGTPRDSRGCLLELTWDGDAQNPVPTTQRTPVKLPTGEERKFLADGDEVIIRGFCERDGFRRIGFGECRGTITAAEA